MVAKASKAAASEEDEKRKKQLGVLASESPKLSESFAASFDRAGRALFEARGPEASVPLP